MFTSGKGATSSALYDMNGWTYCSFWRLLFTSNTPANTETPSPEMLHWWRLQVSENKRWKSSRNSCIHMTIL